MLKMCRGRSRLLILPICITLCSACESIKVKETPAEEPVQEIVEVAYTPLPDVPDSQRYANALKLLEYGEVEQAKVELEAYIARYPDRTKAKRILDQITTDSLDYYPEESFPVTLKPGEALSTLATRYLGDGLQFYALAKYNGIPKPRVVYVGQTVSIPLTPYAQRIRDAQGKPTEPEPLAEPLSATLPETPAPPSDQDEIQEEAVVEEAAEVKKEEEARKLAELRKAQAAQHAEAAARKLDEGDMLNALNNYRQAVEFDPDNENYQSNLASIQQELVAEYHREALLAYRKQQLEDSIALWDKLLAIDAEHLDAQIYRAKAIDLKSRLERKSRTTE